MKDAGVIPARVVSNMFEISLNGEKKVLNDDLSLSALLDSLGLGQRRVAVVRNGDVIHRDNYAATFLAAGDAVDIIHMVGGG